MPDQIDWQRIIRNAKFEKFTSLQAAERQLDRAIVLFIEENDYLCAITLAGAAEGIIGEALRAMGKLPAVELIADAINGGEFDANGQLAELIEGLLTIQDLNRVRNLLKHHANDLNATIEHLTDLEAFNLILRAVLNYALLTEKTTSRSIEFFNWIRKNRPEILEESSKTWR
jgi:hypothetical protein